MEKSTQDTIGLRFKRCHDLFNQAIQGAGRSKQEDIASVERTLEHEFIRFKLWKSNIGVSAELHLCLDFRIRDMDDVKDLFLDHLSTIESRLLQIIYDFLMNSIARSDVKIDDNLRAFASPNASKFKNWTSTELLHSLHESIDWLHRLSNIVRKASFLNQNRRAEKFRLGGSQELHEDITERQRLWFQHVVKSRTSDLNSILLDRIVNTMLIRFTRIKYRRSRPKAWSIPTVEHTTSFPGEAQPKQTKLAIDMATQRKRNPGTLSTISHDHATSVNISAYRKYATPSRVTSGTSPAPISHKDQSLIPPPPKSAMTEADFTCQYCYLILPNTVALSPQWEKHVTNDLDAYVCVFEQCNSPHRLYPTSKEWLSHMANQHRMQWHCAAKGHEALYYETPGELEMHMRTEHMGTFPMDQLQSIVDLSAHPIHPILENCPFCSETHEGYQGHIGKHLQEFALRSLPPLSEDGRQSSHGTSITDFPRLGTNGSIRDSLDDLEVDSNASSLLHTATSAGLLGESQLDIHEVAEADTERWSETVHEIRQLYARRNVGHDDVLASFNRKREEPLDQLIRSAMLYSAGSDRLLFVPIDDLESIMTIPNIIRELEREDLSDSHQLAEQIWSPQVLPDSKTTTRRRLFAILCHMGKATEIRKFIKEGVSDYDLPFEFEASQTLRRSGETIELFAAWDVWNRENFAQFQGRFLAPYFKLCYDDMTKFRDYKLHRCIVLPFLESEMEDSPLDYSSVGGFPVVRRVRIHSAHHNYSLGPGSSEKAQFAVKRLQKTNEAEQSTKKTLNRETAASKRLNRLRHPHIVRLLATYTHRDHLHMIFPWADGNLYQFWRTHFPDLLNLPRTHNLALWMIKQFVGLAAALQKIQSPNPELPSEDLRPENLKKNHGRHGNIKPENILWFKSTPAASQIDGLGNLVISDLGSTEFHGSVSEVWLNAAGGFTETYKAPEFDIMSKISPESDVWSFGCVLLEFIVWYMFGWAGVEEFSKARTKDSMFVVKTDLFFNPIRDENAVEAKPAVRKQFKKLKNHSQTSDFILDLLDFIESRLLRMRSQKRASCDDIVAKFHTIQERCNDRNYCIQRKSKRVSSTETFLSEKVVIFLSSEMRKEYDKSVDPDLRVIPSRSTTQRSSRQGSIDATSRDIYENSPGYTLARQGIPVANSPGEESHNPVGDADIETKPQRRRDVLRKWFKRA